MKISGHYSFDPKESRDSTIHFGKNLKISPKGVGLGKAYPNPTTDHTIIGFSLREAGGINQKVSVTVMDPLGQDVATIARGLYNPGFHEVSWQAKGLVSGFYTYRLRVDNQQGQEMFSGKLIIR